MADNKLAFIGREFNPVWDMKKKELTKFSLLDKNPLEIDFTDKQHTLIIAKSGAGKSYLAGVYAEGLHGGMQNYGVLIIDPLGIFTTLKYPNTNQAELQSWNDQFPGEVVPEGMRNCEMWVPAGDQEQFPEGRYDGLFSLSACDLTPGTLCTSFDMDPLEPQLRLYRKAQKHFLKEQGNYALDELTGWIREHGSEDLHYKDQTVEALISKLEALEELGLVTREGVTLPQMVREGVVVVVNLSASDEYAARVIVNFLAEKILELRKKGKQLVDDLEVKHIKVDRPDWYIPPVQFVIDEAHNFLPRNRILRRCVKEGRNCAFLITAISQAMDLDKKIYGNVTHLFVGALTFNDDIEDVYRILPVDWTPKDFRKEIKILPTDESVPLETPRAGPAAPVQNGNGKLDPILFSEDYPKLHEPKYTTIRRHDKNYQVNQIRPILLKGKGIIHESRILFKHFKALPEIDTQFLLRDTCRQTRDAAIELLNGFYKTPILETEKLCILGLERIP